MLADFQQALADLTASPTLCTEVRRDPALLHARYELTALEARRIEGIVAHPGMACSCIVYRANRLAPLALNLPRTCRALGPLLRDVASHYWTTHPEGNVHFYIEADRFCRHLSRRIAMGELVVPPAAVQALAEERAVIAAALAESELEAGLR